MLYQVVCAVIINEFNQVLIAQRPTYKINPGEYEFPGGKIEVNESKEQALKREIKEELDCRIDVIENFYNDYFDYKSFTVDLYFFICKLIDGEIKMKEHTNIEWVDIKQLSSYPLLESNKKAAQILCELFEKRELI